MKKFIVLFIIVILGLVMIFIPKYLSSDKPHKQEAKKQLNQDSAQEPKQDKFEEISSTEENTEEPTDDELEPQLGEFEKDIYFENGDKLYKAFRPEDVERIKQAIQSYIHSNIDVNISDCKITSTSLKNNIIIITIAIDEKEVLIANVDKDNVANIEIVKK